MSTTSVSTTFRTEAFTETVLYFDAPGQPIIDLRAPVTTREKIVLAHLGLDQPFGICTAANPGYLRPPVANVEASVLLEWELTALDAHCVAVAACSPDRMHCERSFAVILPCVTLLEVAQRYDQLAIFWFDGEMFWIIPTDPSNQKIALPPNNGSVL
jgi:hypothetical protein